MQLYKLTLATIIQRKIWVIALLCVVLLPIVLPYLTPYESNPTLIEPARAQAVWVTVWIVAIAWIFFQAARFGDETASSGIGSYFLSKGVSRISQMTQLWLACMSFFLPLILLTLIICFVGAMPGDDEQASIWVATNFQYAALFLLAIAPLTLFAVSLGSRFGGTIGYIIPVFLVLYGLYGVGYLEMMIDIKDNVLADWVYILSPHYHLADLLPRLLFRQGAMVGVEFLNIVGYFLGLAFILAFVSVVCFRAKPSS